MVVNWRSTTERESFVPNLPASDYGAHCTPYGVGGLVTRISQFVHDCGTNLRKLQFRNGKVFVERQDS